MTLDKTWNTGSLYRLTTTYAERKLNKCVIFTAPRNIFNPRCNVYIIKLLNKKNQITCPVSLIMLVIFAEDLVVRRKRDAFSLSIFLKRKFLILGYSTENFSPVTVILRF